VNGTEGKSDILKGMVILFKAAGASGLMGNAECIVGGGPLPGVVQSGKPKSCTVLQIGDRGGSLNVLKHEELV
jgi:hypothetical protein